MSKLPIDLNTFFFQINLALHSACAIFVPIMRIMRECA